MSRITVSKIEAAKRQLETAIRLWFQDEDVVLIETLAGASYQVIHDLLKNAGKDCPPYENFTTKEQKIEFSNLRKRSENFFKHADRKGDANLIHESNTDSLEYYLYYAIQGWEILSGQTSAWLSMFLFRFFGFAP